MHSEHRAHKHKPVILYMAVLDERFWTPLLSGVHNYVFTSGSCFVYRQQNYLQECCKCRSSRGTDMVWHPCVGEGGAGDVMPSWQQRGNEDTGGTSASDGPCCACETEQNANFVHSYPSPPAKQLSRKHSKYCNGLSRIRRKMRPVYEIYVIRTNKRYTFYINVLI